MKKPGKFSNLIKQSDDKVEKLLSKNQIANEVATTKNEPKDHSIVDHLLLTKSELNKSLSKVLKDTEKIVKK